MQIKKSIQSATDVVAVVSIKKDSGVQKIVRNTNKRDNSRRVRMTVEQIKRNIGIILTSENYNRVSVVQEFCEIVLTIDLHGLTKAQAHKMIKNVILVTRGEYTINLIHGYNRGTVLKNMIMEELLSNRVISKNCPVWNPGQTYLKIAA